MAFERDTRTVGLNFALLSYLVIVAAVFGGVAATLYSLLEPKQLTNPGVTAYNPPAALALYPPPRNFPTDEQLPPATALAEAPIEAPALPQTNTRAAKPTEPKPKREARVRKPSPRAVAKLRDTRNSTVMNFGAPEFSFFRPWN
jgi:hypothetical protein